MTGEKDRPAAGISDNRNETAAVSSVTDQLTAVDTWPSTKRRLRLCMVSQDYLPVKTGLGTHLKIVIPEMVRRGHEVFVITSRGRGQEKREASNNTTVLRLPCVKIYGYQQALATQGMMTRIFETIRPDIVHFHCLDLLLLNGAPAARKLGIPTVYTYHLGPSHLTQPPGMGLFRKLIDRLTSKTLNRIDHIILPSAALDSELVALGVETPFTHISNPLSYRFFAPKE